ncbi:MAG: hypothetical protein ACJ8F3_07980 [Xanthobacteraceae bacterium]
MRLVTAMTSIQGTQQRSSPARGRFRPPKGQSPLLLPLIAVASVAFMGLAWVGYVLWPRGSAPLGLDAPTLPITIGEVTFNVPPAAIRVPLQRRAGTQERIDLTFLWPSLDPPDPNAKPAPADAALTTPPASLDRLFVTIADGSSSLSLADRVLTIYPRYTATEATEGPGGLTVLAFREGTPYEGEDLIYNTVSPGFLMRCTRAGRGGTPGTCLSERRIGTADLTVRLARDWLSDWQPVAAGIERLIGRLRPHS